MKEEHAIGFLQFVLEKYCIVGIDTFYNPDDMENDLTAKQVYENYLKSNHKNAK